MITGFLLTLLVSLVSFFVSLLPVVSIPTDWTSSVSLVFNYVKSFSWLIPVSSLLSVLGVAFTFHLALFGYDLSLKIYHMIRGK